MQMRFKVVTDAGKYEFWQEGKRTFFKKEGAAITWEVVRFRSEHICVGKPIWLDIRQGNRTIVGDKIDRVRELYIIP